MQGIKDILDALKQLQSTIYLACDEKPADDISKIVRDAVAEITSLREQLEIAKKDGERYQWLRKRAFLNRFGWVFENIKYYKEPTTIDEAIDNAMKGKV